MKFSACFFRGFSLCCGFVCLAGTSRAAQGFFSGEGDVGQNGQAGSAQFDSTNGEYLVTGGGENMWSTNDAFHFVWEKMSGDFTLSADVRWPGTNGSPHRKACLVLRQSLAADSAYADVALHASGLTCLQYRGTPGAMTREIQSDLSAPARLLLEKRGDYISMYLATDGGGFEPAGILRLPFPAPFYAGLAVCAHDRNAIASAVFSNVTLVPITSVTYAKPPLESILEVVDVSDTTRHIIYRTRDHIEAPNWSRDGGYFVFNRNGRIYKLPAKGGQPQGLDTGKAVNYNNDHGLSPDGTLLAVSDSSVEHQSRVYVVPVAGGAARQITPSGPSYWHGWSPDGRTLAFCGERNGNFDIYTIPADGGEETRLTTAPGLDDGPDYSPDGKFIYFNSERTGLMQIWRMHPDGSGQEQITSDDNNNWFAHPSRDGRWIVFLTYPKDVTGHPKRKDVMLRLMSLANRKIQVLAKFFGGQGTINVPSWSPDSRHIAFVSYQPVFP